MKCAILIAAYNAEPTLDRALQSLLSQTFQDFRIVVIDDASTDTTPLILARWEKVFGKARFCLLQNKENIGLTKSLNRGLMLIDEPFTARIDHDDWWGATKLEKQIVFLETNPDYGMVGCNYINVFLQTKRPIIMPASDMMIKEAMIRKNPFAHSTVVFRTDIVKKVGSYDSNIRYGQDYDLWLRLLPVTKFANLQEFLCFRTGGKGISVSHQNAQMQQCLRTQLKYLKKYRLPWKSYLFLWEPLFVLALPRFIKDFKRKLW